MDIKQQKDMYKKISHLSSQMTGIKKDVSVVKSDIAGVKSDVEVVKFDVAGVKSDVKEVKELQNATNGNVSELKLWKAKVEGIITGALHTVGAMPMILSGLAAIATITSLIILITKG